MAPTRCLSERYLPLNIYLRLPFSGICYLSILRAPPCDTRLNIAVLFAKLLTCWFHEDVLLIDGVDSTAVLTSVTLTCKCWRVLLPAGSSRREINRRLHHLHLPRGVDGRQTFRLSKQVREIRRRRCDDRCRCPLEAWKHSSTGETILGFRRFNR
jgi:hypothetical protein